MGPPADRDVIMGPPPIPAVQQMAQPMQPMQLQQHSEQDINEKYKKLKRRYFELEEVSAVVRAPPYTNTVV